jgi:hypothetical protein
MRPAGISPALIYAYEETGLIVTQENRRLIPEVELREFDAKVGEYRDLGLGETRNARDGKLPKRCTAGDMLGCDLSPSRAPLNAASSSRHTRQGEQRSGSGYR